MTSRRTFLLGAASALAAPAVVRAESLMQIAALREDLTEANLLKAMEDTYWMTTQGVYVYRAPMIVFTDPRPLLIRWNAAQDHTAWSVAT
jgi:hypothetical protein